MLALRQVHVRLRSPKTAVEDAWSADAGGEPCDVLSGSRLPHEITHEITLGGIFFGIFFDFGRIFGNFFLLTAEEKVSRRCFHG